MVFINLFVIAHAFAFSIDKKNLQQDAMATCLTEEQDMSYAQISSAEVAKLLGWVIDPYDNAFCGGYYENSANIADIQNSPMAIKNAPINVTANKHAFFTQQGISTVEGDVTLVQPGRKIVADCVDFFRDNKTGKIRNSILVGHVRFYEYDKLLAADQSNLDFINEVYTLNNGFYRLQASTPSGRTNVWGRAKYAVHNAAGVLKMIGATYSACPPYKTSWYIRSSKLTFDRNTKRGEAINTVLFFKNAPVFYTPYLNFSLDKTRKSGFLYPDIMHSQDSGWGLFLPYYINLAPNYDAIFTPKFFTRRSVLLEGLFNYLSPYGFSSANINYIPHDRAFVNFRDSWASYKEGHARTVLQNSSAGRGFLGLQNDSRLSEHWKGSLNINYATDDYFLRDFSSAATSINKDQLFNNAELDYADEHLRFLTSFNGFQTLHPITRDGISNVKDQYKRLPQLSLAVDFPEGFGGLDYQFNGEVVNFVHGDDFNTANPIVGGGRFNADSSVSLPLNWLGAYVIPKIQLQATEYSIHDQENINDPNNIFRFLPLISVDGGAIFSRNINFFRHGYMQTLEPRLFYLFVPTKNQEKIPVFDTNFPAFEFNQLFRTNRFAGIDRIGDANQITGAITTRIFNDFGQEKLNASIGQIFVINNHKVLIPNSISSILDPLVDKNFSPLIGQLQYFIIPKVNVITNAAWDPNSRRFNTSNINLQYNDNAERVINFWYNYSLRGDPSPQNQDTNLSRIGFSLGWRLWQHWNILGALDYNVSYKRAQNYIYGLEYDSCCWAIRLVHSRTFIGIDTRKYDSRIYLQFFLKGLGDVGLGNLSSSLPSSISGYNDKHVIGL